MYKTTFMAILFLLLFAAVAQAEDHCGNCGMKVAADSNSAITLKMKDMPVIKLCSLYCYSRLKERDSADIEGILAKDYLTGEELTAESAVWVVGSDAPEPMGDKSHIAFNDRGKAAAFVRKHGGKITTFDEAYKNVLKEWRH